jgi:DNA mismatch repair protein MutS2
MPHGMDFRALTVLEFDRVRSALAERAATNMGRELAFKLQPSTDAYQIRQMLEQVEEAVFGMTLSLGGITDVRGLLERLSHGQDLKGSDILEIAYTLDASMTLKRSVAQHSSGALLRVAEGIGQHVIFTRTVLERLNADGSVRDDATPKLRMIRRRLEPLRSEIRERLTNLMDRHAESLQDRLITIRRDRFVIPVQASRESSVPGIVVDSSASNQTVFIEPASVVPLNNELAKLLIEEEQEVTRILLELARMVADEPGLHETLRAVAELDLIAAKARLAKDWQLNRPQPAARGEFELLEMRHPLIENCQPNSIKLDSKRRILLITGPNMGGKTVTLKSLGLAVLMHQCGMFVRVQTARLPILENILVDVGDEQSIEASLSTFAAHLKNLTHILEDASPDTLVLIDELGSGTDPSEGAALSQAILEKLLEAGARGIVTSHLSPLKVFAFEREDVVNASMGFDLERLAPTFKLNIGQPGRSYALAIANRMGFPSDTLERARVVLGPEGANVEKLLENLERERETLALDAKAAREARDASEREAKVIREKLEKFELERETMMLEAQRKAEGVFRDALDQVRQMKTRVRETETERPKVLNELRDLRAAAQAERPYISAVVREPDPLKPGASVEIPAYGATGTILEIRGDEVLVQMGLLKVTLKKRELKLKRSSPMPKTGGYIAPANFSKELNLRGAHVEEAVDEIRSFIAEAQALRETPIRILHGKGEGVLRRVVRDYLKSDKRVESFHDAQPYEGGHGVTIAHVKV